MRRCLLLCVVAVLIVAASSASAQWHVGMRMVGTGNYFPFMVAASGDDPIPNVDTGIFGYKEFIVGYGETIYGEASFAYSDLTSTFTEDDEEYESGLDWWYFGVSGFYTLMESNAYDVSLGVRYQYGSSTLSADYGSVEGMPVSDASLTGTTSQFSVPIRFNWFLADGMFAIGPEVAFKYTTGSTELEYTPMETGRETVTVDGPEYTGMDTEYSLNLMFMF